MKALLAAIAKDEAPYLPEWIFHHLRIGFDHIRIYINRTNDNSREIIGLLHKHFPGKITLIEADYLASQPSPLLSNLIDANFEKGNPLQSRAYADAFIVSKTQGYDYIAFLDVDEYLYIGTQTISSFLGRFQDLSMPDLVKFRWFSVAFESKKFGLTFSGRIYGVKTRQCKFMLSTSVSDFRIGSTHHVFMQDSHIAWIAGKYPICANENHRELDNWCNEAYIIHRSFRSRPEFFALIMRGEPGGSSQNEFDGYKLSRLKPPLRRDFIEYPPELTEEYEYNYSAFLSQTQISELLHRAQVLVLQRAGAAKRRYLDIPRKVALLSDCLSKFGLPSYKVEISNSNKSS
jgi:hypothetical protein